jgi:hypothetical protein
VGSVPAIVEFGCCPGCNARDMLACIIDSTKRLDWRVTFAADCYLTEAQQLYQYE